MSSPPETLKPNQGTFVSKLYSILGNTDYVATICWNKAGDSFSIKNPTEFAKILPNYYKHSSFQSFVRQLNIYSFHKVQTTSPEEGHERPWDFRHEFFHRDHPNLLIQVKRKSTRQAPRVTSKPAPLATPPIEASNSILRKRSVSESPTRTSSIEPDKKPSMDCFPDHCSTPHTATSFRQSHSMGNAQDIFFLEEKLASLDKVVNGLSRAFHDSQAAYHQDKQALSSVASLLLDLVSTLDTRGEKSTEISMAAATLQRLCPSLNLEINQHPAGYPPYSHQTQYSPSSTSFPYNLNGSSSDHNRKFLPSPHPSHEIRPVQSPNVSGLPLTRSRQPSKSEESRESRESRELPAQAYYPPSRPSSSSRRLAPVLTQSPPSAESSPPPNRSSAPHWRETHPTSLPPLSSILRGPSHDPYLRFENHGPSAPKRQRVEA